jgi:hypothetical protein
MGTQSLTDHIGYGPLKGTPEMNKLAIALTALLFATSFAHGRGGHSSSHSGTSHSSRASSGTYSSSHRSAALTSHRTTSATRRASATTSSRSSAGVKRDAKGRIARSQLAKSDFKREHPCPSTGKSGGACPGYVIDHVKPLKRGGEDKPSNMQWQTKQAAKEKDKWE